MRITFQPKERPDFASICKERVESYFKENKISRHANGVMIAKTLLLFSLLGALYITILSEGFSKSTLLLLCMAMGVVQALIGMNISHDAMHGSYTSNSHVNRWLGYSFDLIGLSSLVWKQTHNMVHHIYTNVPGVDHDIGKGPVFRFSPADKRYWFHRYQHIYMFPFYCLTGLNWIFYSDYYFFSQEIKKQSIPKNEIFWFFFFKAVNNALFLGIPLLVMSFPWWQIVIGYLALQFTGGFMVALIFQLAHLVEGLDFPEPDGEGRMENQWAVHEMHTTSNFGTKNPFLNYICGGLNFQVEHHLFPYICHVHYKKLSPIIRQTAKEFNIPYHENLTGIGAVLSHIRQVKKLGA